MSDEEMYVVLETDQPEQFLSATELAAKLTAILSQRQADLPRDLQQISTVAAQVKRLLDTSCDLDMGADQFLQWYAVRLEK
jgi:Protein CHLORORESPIRATORY REDUCTION 7